MKQITVPRAVSIRMGSNPEPVSIPAGDQQVEDDLADHLIQKGLATAKAGRPKRETTAVSSEEIETPAASPEPKRNLGRSSRTKRSSRS